jgi:hypothetical protein
VAQYRDSEPVLATLDPIAVVERAYSRYEGIIEDLREIVATATQGSTQVGAIKAEMVAIEAQMGLLQAVGVLPRSLGELRIEVDLRTMMREAIKVFEDYGMPIEARDAFADALKLRQRERGRRASGRRASRAGGGVGDHLKSRTCTTRRDDRARFNLDRHPTYKLADLAG